MRNSVVVTAVLALGLLPQAKASEITNKELASACSEKTVVYGRDDSKKLVRAGEKLDGFCAGYLQATFMALKNTSSCKANDTLIRITFFRYTRTT